MRLLHATLLAVLSCTTVINAIAHRQPSTNSPTFVNASAFDYLHSRGYLQDEQHANAVERWLVSIDEVDVDGGNVVAMAFIACALGPNASIVLHDGMSTHDEVFHRFSECPKGDALYSAYAASGANMLVVYVTHDIDPTAQFFGFAANGQPQVQQFISTTPNPTRRTRPSILWFVVAGIGAFVLLGSLVITVILTCRRRARRL